MAARRSSYCGLDHCLFELFSKQNLSVFDTWSSSSVCSVSLKGISGLEVVNSQLWNLKPFNSGFSSGG